MYTKRLLAICLIVLPSIFIASVNAVACYTPNGEDRNLQFGYGNLEDYAPCNAAAAHSMCCAWGSARQSGGSADTCLENGLCGNGENIWRESCTDPTWQDPACIKLFVNGTGYNGTATTVVDGVIITDVTVTNCTDGRWCYGTNNDLCCAQKQGFFINANGEQTAVDPALATSSTSASQTSSSSTLSSTSTTSPTSSLGTSTSSNTPAAATSTSSSSASSGGLSTGAKAGIGGGIGGAAAVVLIVGAIFLVRRRKKKQRQSHRSELADPYTSVPAKNKFTSELPAHGSGKYYDGPFARSEMESNSPSATEIGSKSRTSGTQISKDRSERLPEI